MSGTNQQARAPRRPAMVVAVAASVAVLLTSAVGYAAVDHYDSQITRLAGVIDSGSGDQPTVGTDSMNILVLGSDNREGLSRNEQAKLHVGSADYGQHSDTIMIVHVGKDTSHATSISLPRDSLVTIPEYTDPNGKVHPAHQAKINSAYGEGGGGVGGARLVTRTVQDLTGIHIDHYVEVNFQGFLNMVDALNGVDVCLTTALKDKDSGLNLPAGKQTIAGTQALAYVRVRHVDSDFGRIERQQKFIASMIQKATSGGTIANPLKLNAFLNAALGSLKVDSGLDRDTMFDLANRLSGINIKNITFVTAPVQNGDYRVPGLGSTVLLSKTLSRRVFSQIANDQPIVAPVATPAANAVPAGQISVRVFNAAGVAGLAGQTSNALKTAGYVIAAAPANAPASAGGPATKTVIKYDPTLGTSMTTLKVAFPDATFVATQGLGKTFEIYVGSSYKGLGTAKPTTTKKADPHLNARSAGDNICA